MRKFPALRSGLFAVLGIFLCQQASASSFVTVDFTAEVSSFSSFVDENPLNNVAFGNTVTGQYRYLASNEPGVFLGGGLGWRHDDAFLGLDTDFGLGVNGNGAGETLGRHDVIT